MRPAQKARRLLEGNWAVSITVQSIAAAAWMLVLFAELAALRVSALGAETVVHAAFLLNGKWIYGFITILTLLLDWLLLSPLILGKKFYYWKLAAGEEVSYTLIFSFYRHNYVKSLQWRLSLFWRRLMWSALFCIPAALVMGYAEIVRHSGADTPLMDITLLLCTLFGFLLLITGCLASGMVMLRYFPASYLLTINQQKSVREIFRDSCQLMRGHIGELFWLYVGFTGWLVTCLLILPYFYVSPLFHTSRIVAVRRFMAGFKQTQHVKLHSNKKLLHGNISKANNAKSL